MCILNIPSNLQFISLNINSANLNGFSVNLNIISLDFNGILNLTISNIKNPNLYDGNRTWSISCTDSLSYSVSSGNTIQSSEYLPVTSSVVVSLSNNII